MTSVGRQVGDGHCLLLLHQAAFPGYTHTHFISYSRGCSHCSQAVPHSSLCTYCAPSTHGLRHYVYITSSLSQTERGSQTAPVSSQMLPKSEGKDSGCIAGLENPRHSCSVSVCLSAQPCICVTVSVGYMCLSSGLRVCAGTRQPTPRFHVVQGTVSLSLPLPMPCQALPAPPSPAPRAGPGSLPWRTCRVLHS